MNALLARIQRRHAGDVPTLAEAIGPGPWLCVAPHDDDVCLGMGLTVAAATAAGIAVHQAVSSDGGMGYPRPKDQATIGATPPVAADPAAVR